MAWLHENREEFFDAVNLAAERYGGSIVWKGGIKWKH